MSVLLSAAQRFALALLLALAGAVVPAAAHEIQASVADLGVTGGEVRLDVQVNAEAWLAGIGPEHEDTDAAPEAGEYDRLRALPPAELASELEGFSPTLEDAFTVTANGERVPLTVSAINVGPVGDLELARATSFALSGPLPAGVEAITVALSPEFGDLILRGTGDNESYGEYLQAGTESQEIAAVGPTQRGAWDVFVQYLGVGFEHILPLGLDHILFVIGLFLLQPRVRPLLWQVSAFTLAHTVTLALGALDIVRVPGSIVEPLIALSIVYVCVENIVSSKLHAWRPLVIFAFGLLHGLGFASVFEEYGIPEGQFVPALLAFNIGVEIGQLTVIAACFLAVGLWFRNRDWYRQAISIPASFVIAAIGLYWSVTRVGLVPEFIPYI